MLVVIPKSQLVQLIRLTRDDRWPQRQWKCAPFLRFEARQGEQVLRVTGREVEGTVPATVHTPGVVFLRATRFSDALELMHKWGGTDGGEYVSLAADGDGLRFGDTRLATKAVDLLVYPDMDRAPAIHPAERSDVGPPNPLVDPGHPAQGRLFPP